MNGLEEQPLENTVILPTPTQVETTTENIVTIDYKRICFFCRKAFDAESPQIQLSCKCHFHTSCFLERQFVLDEDNIELYNNDTGLIELYLRNNCPLCRDTIYKQDVINTILNQPVEERIQAYRIRTRNRIRRNSIETSFLEKYNSDKKCKDDVKNLKKVIAQLRKNFNAFDKKRKLLSQEFQTEIDPLKKLIQQIQKNSLNKLNTVEELKSWRSSRARFEYFKRKFIADHKITDFNGICKIKQLRLPNRWTLYRLLTGGRYYYRRYRQFGCRI